MTTYNHAFTIDFAVSGSKHPEGDDITAAELRTCVLSRLAALDDDELFEAVGMPFDSYKEEEISQKEIK